MNKLRWVLLIHFVRFSLDKNPKDGKTLILNSFNVGNLYNPPNINTKHPYFCLLKYGCFAFSSEIEVIKGCKSLCLSLCFETEHFIANKRCGRKIKFCRSLFHRLPKIFNACLNGISFCGLCHHLGKWLKGRFR